MHIGLIGGIGPAATVIYYRELVGLYAAAGCALPLTIANAEVRTMTANLAAGRAVEQAGVFARLIDQLRDGGCEIAALTSMGGHFCIDELRKRSSLPLVSAVDALEHFFADGAYAKVGVLGTRAVMSSGLYGLNSVEVVAPEDDDLGQVNDAYVAIATAGAASAISAPYSAMSRHGWCGSRGSMVSCSAARISRSPSMGRASTIRSSTVQSCTPGRLPGRLGCKTCRPDRISEASLILLKLA